MSESFQIPGEDTPTLIVNDFIRYRNILLTHADFTPLFTDFFQHLQRFGINLSKEQGVLFRDFLAAFALHAASLPRNAVLSWTVHLTDPLINVFLTGDTEFSTLTGRLFTDGVKDDGEPVLYQDLKRAGKPMHRSIVAIPNAEPLRVVEHYYGQSEQRPARLFHLGEDRYALLGAHPDWDHGWFSEQTPESLLTLSERETLARIESRSTRWLCGCHHQKILEVLTLSVANDLDEVFEGEEVITVNCPRCGGKYRVSREALEDNIARASES